VNGIRHCTSSDVAEMEIKCWGRRDNNTWHFKVGMRVESLTTGVLFFGEQRICLKAYILK